MLGSTTKSFECEIDAFECERTCAGAVDGPIVCWNKGATSSWKANVAWYGLADPVLDASEPVLKADTSLLRRPPQVSLIL
jgi:hypothetical protein